MCISAIVSSEENMSLESMMMLVVSVLMAVYLGYALLRPENF
jgi:K+-transporting ATPase KdpF subunit